jgi:hypothetical protein
MNTPRTNPVFPGLSKCPARRASNLSQFNPEFAASVREAHTNQKFLRQNALVKSNPPTPPGSMNRSLLKENQGFTRFFGRRQAWCSAPETGMLVTGNIFLAGFDISVVHFACSVGSTLERMRHIVGLIRCISSLFPSRPVV